ncbi:MAG: hypothetical protein WC565_04345 [Parcubacteria group bacterium]
MSQRYQTRGVLGGAYRGPDLARRTLLTHLLDTETDRSGCRVPGENLADEYADPKGNGQRPTCPRCAKKWDALQKPDDSSESSLR